MPDYASMLAQKVAEIEGDAKAARALYDKYGTWINKYRGGLPGGWMATIMLWESGGDFGSAGDPGLGEAGFYQIAAYVPELFGLDAVSRLDPETNVCLACLEYDLEAILFAQSYPQVRLGTADSWKLARLAFAVGRAGSRALANAAAVSGGLRSGDVYGSISDYVKASGGMPLGSQSADKVWYRVLNIDVQWAIGQRAVGGEFVGPPIVPPDPPTGPIAIPPAVLGYFSKPASAIVLLGIAALAGALIYAGSRRSR